MSKKRVGWLVVAAFAAGAGMAGVGVAVLGGAGGLDGGGGADVYRGGVVRVGKPAASAAAVLRIRGGRTVEAVVLADANAAAVAADPGAAADQARASMWAGAWHGPVSESGVAHGRWESATIAETLAGGGRVAWFFCGDPVSEGEYRIRCGQAGAKP